MNSQWSSPKTELVLQEGALCPRCKSGAMSFNADKALEGGQFVVCNRCHIVYCAVCGEPGLEHFSTGTQPPIGEAKYICPNCLAGAVVLLDPFDPCGLEEVAGPLLVEA